jgi:putative secretion ATPase (PEP-CTERM system associated)
MYEAFYGLKVKPFQLNPDPSFYFDSKEHRRAKSYLDYGLFQHEGFIVLTGEVGAGKTTIVRRLLGNLDDEKVVAAQVVSTQLDADNILRMVAAAFGVHLKDVGKAELIITLEAFFVDVARNGKHCLLVVDEAQNLSREAIEELRMLSNFQIDTHALLQIFLVGQPEFRVTMSSPDMEQLRQRVIATCHIGPLNILDTRNYIFHRLRCAGYTHDPKIDDAAHEAIFRVSGGIPRRINNVCDRLLLAGFLANKKLFGKADVEEVARQLNANTRFGTPKASLPLQAESSSAGGVGVPLASPQVVSQLQRMERSMVRLEKTNTLLLRMMQQIVEAARKRHPTKTGTTEKPPVRDVKK